MTKIAITTAALTALLDASATVATQVLDSVEPTELDLIADAQDQAIDAFMEEREYLQADIRDLEALADAHEAVISNLGDAATQANQAFVQIAQYASALQARLNSIGISHVADEATGRPNLTIDVEQLRGFLAVAQLAQG